MKTKTLLALALFFAVSVAAAPADNISGEWNATLNVHEPPVPITFKLTAHDGKLTGTSESAHVGDGQIEGTYTNDTVQFTASGKFIVTFSGTLKDGKLSGEFTSDHASGTWEATRK